MFRTNLWDKKSSYENLLEKDNSASTHHEIFKH